MKAIMISIKPKWVAKILNGEKTIEIRKTMPKCELPIDVYIYCTKDNSTNAFYGYNRFGRECLLLKDKKFGEHTSLNGKLVAKFTLKKVEEIKTNLAMRFFTESANEKELLEKSCLNSDQLFWYLAPQELKVKCCGYAWHIDNLEIFDKPKELSNFYKGGDWGCDKAYYGDEAILTKAPQSWCYIESED